MLMFRNDQDFQQACELLGIEKVQIEYPGGLRKIGIGRCVDGAKAVARLTGEVIERHKKCLILAAANTFGRGGDHMYVGRNALDAATLDRFVLCTLHVGYDSELESEIARSILGPSQADVLLGWVAVLREKIAANRLRRIASTRLIVNSAAAMKRGATITDVHRRYLQDWSQDELAKFGGAK